MKNRVFTFLLPKRRLIYQKSAQAERNINIFEFYLGAARFIVYQVNLLHYFIYMGFKIGIFYINLYFNVLTEMVLLRTFFVTLPAWSG